MSEKVIYFQPKYFSKFKCNGQKCKAHCCKGWRITIDKNTFKSYKKVESAEKEISSKIFSDDGNRTRNVQLDNRGWCPFLTPESWCSIQLKYGEKYLSQTCQTYPRIIKSVDGTLQCSLTLSCPVAAELVLTANELTDFELIQGEPLRKKIGVDKHKFPPKIESKFFDIQVAALSILKNKSLSIDQRLAVLGIFLGSIEDLVNRGNFADIPKVALAYRDDEFYSARMGDILNNFPFQPKEFLKIMLSGVIETLYGKESALTAPPRHGLIPTLFNNFKVIFGLNEVTDESVKKIFMLGERRKEFVKKFENMFENYLVNEFFMGLYPFRLEKPIFINYGVFLATYKIVELFSFIMHETFTNNVNETSIISFIAEFSRSIDHNNGYLEKISQEFADKKNIVEIMTTFLQA